MAQDISQLTDRMEIEHGGNIAKLCDYFQIPLNQAVDFSASINPLGLPPKLDEFLKDQSFLIQHYPDPWSEGVRDVLARYLDIPGESILVGNGSMEILDLVLRVLKPKVVAVMEPAFSEYERLSKNNGSQVRSVMTHDLDALREAEMIFVGNPGNPTGRLVEPHRLVELLTFTAMNRKWLLIDEAFVEFAGEEASFITSVARCERLICIRSATKFFALPGLRLGYLAAHPEVTERLRSYQLPWSVNVMAQEAAKFVFQDHEFQRKSREFVAKERAWLAGQLKLLGWVKPYPSDANFILCELDVPLSFPPRTAIRRGNDKMFDLFHYLGRKGIFIRPCHNFKGLGPQFFRIAVRRREENQKLIEALKEGFES